MELIVTPRAVEYFKKQGDPTTDGETFTVNIAGPEELINDIERTHTICKIEQVPLMEDALANLGEEFNEAFKHTELKLVQKKNEHELSELEEECIRAITPVRQDTGYFPHITSFNEVRNTLMLEIANFKDVENQELSTFALYSMEEYFRNNNRKESSMIPSAEDFTAELSEKELILFLAAVPFMSGTTLLSSIAMLVSYRVVTPNYRATIKAYIAALVKMDTYLRRNINHNCAPVDSLTISHSWIKAVEFLFNNDQDLLDLNPFLTAETLQHIIMDGYSIYLQDWYHAADCRRLVRMIYTDYKGHAWVSTSIRTNLIMGLIKIYISDGTSLIAQFREEFSMLIAVTDANFKHNEDTD